MTIQEWQENPKFAAELVTVLKNPILVVALSLVKESSMAHVIANSTKLFDVAQNGQTLFGYDVGRASVFIDLEALTVEVKKTPTIKPTYAN